MTKIIDNQEPDEQPTENTPSNSINYKYNRRIAMSLLLACAIFFYFSTPNAHLTVVGYSIVAISALLLIPMIFRFINGRKKIGNNLAKNKTIQFIYSIIVSFIISFFFCFTTIGHVMFYYTYRHGKPVQSTPLKIIGITQHYHRHGLRNFSLLFKTNSIYPDCFFHDRISIQSALVIQQFQSQSLVKVNLRTTPFAIFATSIVNTDGNTIPITLYIFFYQPYPD